MNCVAAPDRQLSRFSLPQNTVPYLQQLTIFCDFDGPIVDVSNRYYSTYQLALTDTQGFYQAQGITLPIQTMSKQQFWHMKQERIPDEEIAMRSGLRGEQIDFFLGRVIKIVNESALLNKDQLQPNLNWALALLHSYGIRLVLVTLRSTSQVKQILSNYGLTRLFSGIYGTTENHHAYQNYAQVKQELLQEALSEHSTSSDTEQSLLAEPSVSAWMIGDTEADILAGQALSIPTIALTCGIRSQSYLKRFEPTHICSDLLCATSYLLELSRAVGSTELAL
ncbi:HAD hydrolase-like protein [Moorena producens JHB]|uniref:HAD hydrolase-like protein n=1 Tax=Moorena producens (strain JHB) TaxID=1454205 RepID=A0A1D9G1L0_MOOP1|nr:HAD hydrolase-like protein [Moorena producens]AOY81310.1 HAD hydrolase-like protein [Moorena producens JHB]